MPTIGAPRGSIDTTELETVDLDVINYDILEKKSPAEMKKLLLSASVPGFFYVNFEGGIQNSILGDLAEVYRLTEAYFAQPLDVKMNDFRPEIDRGYKCSYQQETYEISRDERKSGKIQWPETLEDHSELLSRFSTSCDSITKRLLSTLSEALNCSGQALNFHDEQLPSDTGLKLCHTSKSAEGSSGKEHTDSGTLTLLFCDKWGVQIYHPQAKKWAFVKPQPNQALINVGDYLQYLSKDRLHSCLHRVVQPEGTTESRYSVVYFLRPGKLSN